MLSFAVLVVLSMIGSTSAACSYGAPYDLSTTPSTLTTASGTFTGGTYYIQPCGNVDISLCPYSTGQQQCFAILTWETVSDGLGAPDQTTWTALNNDWSQGAVALNTDISYDYDQCNADPSTNSFKTTYKCDKGDDSLRVITEPDASKNGPCIFEVEVDSSIVCGHSGGGGGNGGGDGGSKKGLSGGWIFVILLIVAASVYLIGGVAWNRFRKGASGVEMLPHRGFWKDLPILVKDGCSYFVQKCRGLCGRNVGGSADSTSFATM